MTALAAFQAFFFNNQRIIYLDTANRQLLQLSPEADPIPLRDNLLKVRDYLASYGMKLISSSDSSSMERRPCLQDLVALLVSDPALLSRLNSAIDRIPGNPPFVNLDLNSLGDGGDRLAQHFEQCKVAARASSFGLNIPSPEKIFFCQGGWLEEHAYWAVRDLGIKGLDLAMNVRVAWDGKGKRPTENEFDVLFTHDNRLHLISCKASNPNRETATGSRATEALNELDALADRAGGLFGKAMLVSARRLSDYDRERARKMRIKLVEAEAIPNLRAELKEWLGGSA